MLATSPLSDFLKISRSFCSPSKLLLAKYKYLDTVRATRPIYVRLQGKDGLHHDVNMVYAAFRSVLRDTFVTIQQDRRNRPRCPARTEFPSRRDRGGGGTRPSRQDKSSNVILRVLIAADISIVSIFGNLRHLSQIKVATSTRYTSLFIYRHITKYYCLLLSQQFNNIRHYLCT